MYSGECERGALHGKGVLEDALGNTYVGYFERGLRHGKGVEVRTASSTKWVGVWHDGAPSGSGVLYQADGSMVRGTQWTAQGQPLGVVVVTRPTDEVGTLYAGHMVGFGVEVSPEMVHFGMWAQGRVRR